TRLESIESTVELRVPEDLLDLIGLPKESAPFNTADLAAWTDLPRWKTQQIAYVLRKTGAVEVATRNRNGIVYRRAG
ncbi:MAG: hypothetical protein VYA84_16870, partial [Planctomycetota bacterium]|nr:hypothetical protein [Planctomycetota bacterium]